MNPESSTPFGTTAIRPHVAERLQAVTLAFVDDERGLGGGGRASFRTAEATPPRGGRSSRAGRWSSVRASAISRNRRRPCRARTGSPASGGSRANRAIPEHKASTASGGLREPPAPSRLRRSPRRRAVRASTAGRPEAPAPRAVPGAARPHPATVTESAIAGEVADMRLLLIVVNQRQQIDLMACRDDAAARDTPRMRSPRLAAYGKTMRQVKNSHADCLVSASTCADDARWHAGGKHAIRNGLRDDGAGTDDGVAADVGEHDGRAADPGAPADPDRPEPPRLFANRPRQVVDAVRVGAARAHGRRRPAARRARCGPRRDGIAGRRRQRRRGERRCAKKLSRTRSSPSRWQCASTRARKARRRYCPMSPGISASAWVDPSSARSPPMTARRR